MVQNINPHPAPWCNRSPPPYYVFSKDAILGSVPSISSEVLELLHSIMRVPNLYHLDVKKDESGSFECKHCGKKFDRRKGYIYHVVNTHTANRNFPCTQAQCNYKAKNQMLLTRHVNRLHKQVCNSLISCSLHVNNQS